MIKIIIKREIYENCTSFTRIERIPIIIYPIVKWYWEIKGYEVEVSEEC